MPNAPISETHSATDFDKLYDLIKDIKYAMLTTVAADGTLGSRPMTTQKLPEGRAFDGTLWFFTGKGNTLVKEIANDASVNLSYADPGDTKFVSVSGTASISTDRELMKEMWSDLYKAWFPKGLDDPDICLLRVVAERVEYWEPPLGKMIQFLGMLKAAATGERVAPGGHHEIEFDAGGAAKVKTKGA
jgi:general stress protein 26